MNVARRLDRVGRWLALAVAALVLVGLGLAVAADRNRSSKRLDIAGTSRLIDAEVRKRLDADQIAPSPVCDDAEFIRRVYLDIAGVVPPADKVSAFLESTDAGKRAQLIDDLL